MDYIEYFDLEDLNDFVVNNVNPDATGSSSSDYHSDGIIISSGIPIGVGQDLTTQLYVSLLHMRLTRHTVSFKSYPSIHPFRVPVARKPTEPPANSPIPSRP